MFKKVNISREKKIKTFYEKKMEADYKGIMFTEIYPIEYGEGWIMGERYYNECLGNILKKKDMKYKENTWQDLAFRDGFTQAVEKMEDKNNNIY